MRSMASETSAMASKRFLPTSRLSSAANSNWRCVECLMKILSQRTKGSVRNLVHNPGNGRTAQLRYASGATRQERGERSRKVYRVVGDESGAVNGLATARTNQKRRPCRFQMTP